jgi:formylmethanofuran dehydrogenase subunit E
MAILIHIDNDMGGGGAYCSECKEMNIHSAWDLLNDYPINCRKCGEKFMGEDSRLFNTGGSDF